MEVGFFISLFSVFSSFPLFVFSLCFDFVWLSCLVRWSHGYIVVCCFRVFSFFNSYCSFIYENVWLRLIALSCLFGLVINTYLFIYLYFMLIFLNSMSFVCLWMFIYSSFYILIIYSFLFFLFTFLFINFHLVIYSVTLYIVFMYSLICLRKRILKMKLNIDVNKWKWCKK